VLAIDRDAPGPNAALTYFFDPATGAAHGHVFAIDSLTGQVTVVGGLDRDRGPTAYRLTVVARDQAVEPLSTTTVVRINVTDVNDLAPEIVVDGLISATLSSSSSSSKANGNVETVRVVENARSGTPVAHVTVNDGDSGDAGRFNCSLVDDNGGDDDSDHFRLRRFDETEFQLVVSVDAGEQTIDRERRDEYRLTIVCTDFGLPVPMTSRQAVVVVVDDVNDNAPEFEQPLYRAELIENNYVGAFVVHVAATDRDVGPNGRLEYRMVADDPGSEYFRCDPITGAIVASRSIDRETLLPPGGAGGPITFRVVAIDGGAPSRTASTLVAVNVQDVNDNRPTFDDGGAGQFRFSVVENQPIGTSVGSVRAVDPDIGSNGAVRYYIEEDDHESDAMSSSSAVSHHARRRVHDRHRRPE
jgi:protocadherin delta 1